MTSRNITQRPECHTCGRAAPVADFTYVWTACGFCYVSFITDVYSRRILGWRASMSKTTDLVTAALAQALATRRRADSEFTSRGLVHHSDYAEPCVKPRNRVLACAGGVA